MWRELWKSLRGTIHNTSVVHVLLLLPADKIVRDAKKMTAGVSPVVGTSNQLEDRGEEPGHHSKQWVYMKPESSPSHRVVEELSDR